MKLINDIIDFIRNIIRKMPKELSDAAHKIVPIMKKIDEILESNESIVISNILGVNSLRSESIELIHKLLPIIQSIEDMDVRKGVMSRLGSMLVHSELNKEVSIGKCVIGFECVLNSK